MIGRFSAVSKKTYAEAIREDFGFRFYILPLARRYFHRVITLQ